MGAYNCYDAAQKIAEQLSEAGYKEWSDRIVNEIAAGFTSGEILQGIWWHLKKFQKAELAISDSLASEISELISWIEKAFKEVGSELRED